MRKLGKKNGFTVEFKARRNELVTDNLAGQMNEANTLLKSFFPAIFVRHYSFIDFEKFGFEWRPDWFNVIRNPVEKVISYFYYRRAPWKLKLEQNLFHDFTMPSEDFMNKDLTTCILDESDPECRFVDGEPIGLYGNHAIMQFCGHDPYCTLFNNEQALAKAKNNVEQFFPVVGLVENMTMTLSVAESVMPEYFKGARKAYFEDPKIMEPKNANPSKPKVTQKIKDILTKKFRLELEFYEFCKRRLYSQYNSIKANKLPSNL